MKHKTTKTLALLLVVAILLAGLCGCSSGIRPQKVTDPETISWLEGSDPDAYSEAKEEIKDLLANELGVYPDQVAFSIDANSSGVDYSYLRIYYKDGAGWKGFSLNWLSLHISPELDQAILSILN